MLLQVHDELVFTMEPSEQEKLLPAVINFMDTSMDLSVPLEVEAKIGDNWGEMEKIDA